LERSHGHAQEQDFRGTGGTDAAVASFIAALAKHLVYKRETDLPLISKSP
jgi:hypothetical protein